MKKLLLSSIIGIGLLTSCIVPNPNGMTSDGFEVDMETTSLIVASGLIDKDSSYTDELVKISDKLHTLTIDEVVTVAELKTEIENAILANTTKGRRARVLTAFEVVFNIYRNATNDAEYLTTDSVAAIKSIADGIDRALEIYWLTTPIDVTK